MEPNAFFNQNKRFFFEDRAAAAAYVRENCGEEWSNVLHTAELAAEGKFLFELRWDMEQTHTPEVFDGPIDWLRQPGDDPEFVYAFNRMRFWPCMGQAYAITGDEKYAAAFASQLVHWVNTVKRAEPKNAAAWRTIETGIRMENWCKAMAYFEGSPSITPAVMDAFVSSMTEHAEFIMSVWNSYNLMSNWGVLANHGLFVAGVMLPETERTAQYRAEALRRLSQELSIQVYRDGMQWEQSPMYHNEVLRCFLDVVLLASRNKIDLPAGMWDAVHQMALADLAQQKPNGAEPMLGDSDDIDQRDLVTLAAAIFEDGRLKYAGYSRLDFDSAWELGAAEAARYAALPAVRPACTDFALSDSGNYTLRSGWGPEDTWVHFHCGTLGAGHGHSDQLHFDLFAHGEDILTDAGRFTYVFGPRRCEFKDSSAHNTTTVDGKHFYTLKDSWECSKLSRAVNRSFWSDNRYGYAEGGHLGYMDKGVFVNRRLIFIKPDILIVADEFYANAPHEYRQHFHFGGAGRVSDENGQYRYESEKNDLKAVLLSAYPIVTGLGSARVSRHYNQAEDCPALESQVQGTGFTSAYAVFSLDPAGVAEPLTVKRLAVRSNFKDILFADEAVEALCITKGERTYTVAVAHMEYASPTDTFQAGGCTGFGNVVVFDHSANETEVGTVLSY